MMFTKRRLQAAEDRGLLLLDGDLRREFIESAANWHGETWGGPPMRLTHAQHRDRAERRQRIREAGKNLEKSLSQA